MFKTLQRAWRQHQLRDPAYQFLFDPAPPDEWVSIDCETTGLDRAQDHIISIGAQVDTKRSIGALLCF